MILTPATLKTKKLTAMTKGEKIINVASREIGNVEFPANTNKTKYGKWFGLDGVRWCGTFVSWCYAHAGYPLGNIGFTKGFAGCQTAVAYFKKHKKIVSDPQPGDIVFFDFNNDGRHDHTGIFVSGNRKSSSIVFECIEGNTSKANDSNGGIVMKRLRKYENCIFVRP
jgi:cell wall-associated NlpC family hydrolase